MFTNIAKLFKWRANADGGQISLMLRCPLIMRLGYRAAFQKTEQKFSVGKANEGVAMGLAMETPALPADANFGISGGMGYFNNATAASMAATARVSEKATLSAGVGIGFETGEVGARGGFQVVW